MDHQRHAAAMTDEAVGDEIARDIARALAVDPSPDFLARVRMQIANEPRPTVWRTSWMLSAFALVAVAVVLAVVVNRPDGAVTRGAAPLAARAIAGDISIPYVGSGFLAAEASAMAVSRTTGGPPKGGRHVRMDSIGPHVQMLLDPRETEALRSLIAGVQNNSVDLSPLLRHGAPAPMELPPVDDLVIAPLAIEPLAPIAGAQGERQ